MKHLLNRAPAAKHFVILGLPRSGSTYLMDLLGSHPQIFCTGEQFNPWAVVGTGRQRDKSYEAVVEGRDARPEAFMQDFFAAPRPAGTIWAGFKFMLGHNIRAFRWLETQPDIALIHVWRENRLAQAASWLKALESQRWTQGRVDDHVQARIDTQPRKLSELAHEAEMMDYLFQHWLAAQPHPKLTLEYREMFQPGFHDQLRGFLGVDGRPMRSGLVKQGVDHILDRFEDPGPIRNYFNRTGQSHWLEEEIGA